MTTSEDTTVAKLKDALLGDGGGDREDVVVIKPKDAVGDALLGEGWENSIWKQKPWIVVFLDYIGCAMRIGLNTENGNCSCGGTDPYSDSPVSPFCERVSERIRKEKDNLDHKNITDEEFADFVRVVYERVKYQDESRQKPKTRLDRR